jgi:hypothetical protein
MKHAFSILVALFLLTGCKLPASRASTIPPVSTFIDIIPAASRTPQAPKPGSRSETGLTPAPSSTTDAFSNPAPTIGNEPLNSILCHQPGSSPQPAAGQLRVVYTSSRDLWLWEEGKELARLTQAGDVDDFDLSDDGSLVAYVRKEANGQGEIWLMDLVSKQKRLFITNDQILAMRKEPNVIAVTPTNLQWAPGKHLLAFNTFPSFKGQSAWVYVPQDLWLVDAESGQLASLLSLGRGGQAVFSPDGSMAAVLSTDSLSLVSMDGSSYLPNILKPYQAIREGESYFFPQPSWSTDSSYLLVGLPATSNMYASGSTTEIWRVPANGSTPSSLAKIEAFPPSISFSPDLRLLAFWPWPEEGSNIRQLTLTDLDSLSPLVYDTGLALEFLGWATGSHRFLYWKGGAQAGAYVWDACGTPQLIPDALNGPAPIRWVDNTRFLTIYRTAGPWEIRLAGTDGVKTIAQAWGDQPSFDAALLPENSP